MEKIQNNQLSQFKTSKFFQAIILLFMSMIVSSCEVIGGIFKAGMSFGIFIVIAIILVVIFLIIRIGKRKD